MHDYHRQRQNLHYQALNQPGIVCGLGVRLIPAPMEIPPRYRDDRWLEIQPGIAIDLVGNPIVIPQSMQFRIASEASTQAPLTVYLVISHVDPEKLHRKDERDFVQETFRVDEKASLPGALDVELCRIHLQPGVVSLNHPKDVFFPGDNTLDLRYRPQAQARSRTIVRVAQVTHQNSETNEYILGSLSNLLQSVTGLYPVLQAALEPGQLTLQPEAETNLLSYDLLYLTRQQFLLLEEPELNALKKYVQSGGVLLIEASTKGTRIDALRAVKKELQEVLVASRSEVLVQKQLVRPSASAEEAELEKIRQELQAELEAIKADLEAQTHEHCVECKNFAQQLATPLEELSRTHPLRTQPFLFSSLPCLNDQPIQLLTGGGVVLIVGDLSFAWGLDEELALTRSTIREVQELGINILHFAWRRRQMIQLLQAGANTDSEKQGIDKSVLNQLLE